MLGLGLERRAYALKRVWKANNSRVRRLYLRRAFDLNIAVVPVPHGKLAMDVRDTGVAQKIYLTGEHEPEVGRILLQHITPDSVVLDLGANLGYFTTLLAPKVARVLAVEPEPRNVALLRRNVAMNPGAARVTIAPVAVANVPSTAHLSLSGHNFGDHRIAAPADEARKHVTVRVDTVDRLCADHGLSRVDLVKIDVQGHEVRALLGMIDTIHRNPQITFVMELSPSALHDAGTSVEALLDLLESLRLTRWTLIDLKGQIRNVTRTDVLAIAEHDYPSLLIRR